jgi:uncharacterized protein YeaO (DUF488 family)
MAIHIKRVYEPFDKADGYRVLVDRLWPRGIKKENAHVDVWMKDVAPSVELRRWFNHDPEKWKAFSVKYRQELKGSGALRELANLSKRHRTMTLVYGARDEEHNQAVVLKKIINSRPH